MKEVKEKKKPILFYYIVALAVIFMFNAIARPYYDSKSVKQVDYGTFMNMTEDAKIADVQIEENQILFKDKDGNEVLEPIYISAPEFQVLDNANHPDAKLGKDNNRQAASLYDMIPAVPQNAKPFGEWNKAKIMVYKGTVVHGQNDENVLEYHLWTKQWTEMLQASKFSEEKWPLAFELLNNCGGENHEGFIGVQDHGDDVWYRNIRVKVLD